MGSSLPRHYAEIEVPPKPRFGWFGMALVNAWRAIGKIPVFADICGVVVALGVGVTSIGEYAAALFLLLFAALALTSKLWHSDNVRFLKVIGTCCILFVFIIFSAIVWDAKGANPWSHLPRAGHRMMVALGISKETILPPPPRPQFEHEIRLSHERTYKNGMMVDGIKWRDDLREYSFTIENQSPSVEVSNFREHLFLPVAVLRMESVSCLGCDGVSFSMGEGGGNNDPPRTVVIQNGKIVRTDDSGINDVSVAVTRMLPEAKLTIKMIASIVVSNPSNLPGAMIYGSNFSTPAGQAHFGRIVRFMTLSGDGAINIGPELHKKGHTFGVPVIWSFGHSIPGHSQAITPPMRVSPDLWDKPDDE